MTAAPSQRPPALEELLCFDLYAASRSVTAFYRPLLDELGLTYPQYLVVVLLHGSGASSIGEIARDLQLDHATLTPLLRRMEQAGLVTRTRRVSDERVVEIALTAEGERVHARFDEVQCQVIEAMGLDAAGMRRLQRSLRKLTDSVIG